MTSTIPGALEPSSLPMETHYEPPEVPFLRGSVASTWFLIKAPLKGLVKVKGCRDTEQSHRPCLGLLFVVLQRPTC